MRGTRPGCARLAAGLIFLCVLGSGPSRAEEPVAEPPLGPDAAWFDAAAARPPDYSGSVRTSAYVTLKDGVRLAVDVHLPEGLEAGAKLPAIIEQTRYYRAVRMTPEAGGGCKPRIGTTANFMVPRGYAYVVVDVRGTGASFGTRFSEYSDQEVEDGAEIVDWIVQQPWSDGTVGATGQSYVGTTAEMLLRNHHPAVKAVMPVFSGYDFFTEIMYPGGIKNTAFGRRWTELIRALDLGQEPEGSKFAVPCPVDDDTDGSLLRAAMREHEGNFDLWRLVDASFYRDDVFEGRVADASSLYHFQDAIDASGVPVYAVAGYVDSAYTLGAIRRFLTSRAADKRMLIGPWNHGGRFFYGPGVREPTRSAFVLDAEKLRFFDAYLKNIDNGFRAEAAIHYFTTGINRWRAADSWPTPAETQTWCFGAGQTLDPECASAPDEGSDRYQGGAEAKAGELTRWHSTMGPYPVAYPDRAAEDAGLLTYTSAPLDAPLEVTGEPVVTLFFQTADGDADFFVYLEEVTAQGEVNYVTEGLMRASHRKAGDLPFRTLAPEARHRRGDALPVPPGETVSISFGLYPLSHVFAKGSRLCVAIAPSDRSQFTEFPARAASWTIFRAGDVRSAIALPVAPAPE